MANKQSSISYLYKNFLTLSCCAFSLLSGAAWWISQLMKAHFKGADSEGSTCEMECGDVAESNLNDLTF